MDEYGFIRTFIPRKPTSLFILAYRKKADRNLTIFELTSIESKVRKEVIFLREYDGVGYHCNHLYSNLLHLHFHYDKDNYDNDNDNTSIPNHG